MKKLATSLTLLLLAGCQATPPTTAASPVPTDLQLHARGAADTVGKLQLSPQEHLQALTSLNESGYMIGYDYASMRNATFTLDVVPFEGDEKKLNGVLFADYLAALAEAQRDGVSSAVPSLNLIDGITKQVNDGVYARLELLWEQQRMGPAREQLRKAVSAAWGAHQDDPQWRTMLVKVLLASKLAGGSPEVPAGLQAQLDQASRDFEADLTRSQPLGFYTLTDGLKQVFRADRELQGLAYFDGGDGIDDAAAREGALAAGLVAGDAALGTAMEQAGSFYRLMANPFNAFTPGALAALKPAEVSWDDLAGSASARLKLYQAGDKAKQAGMFNAYAWMPPSRSVEDALFAQAPDVPDLMAYLIQEVQAGRVSLAPTPESGFYQYQEYALEALLTPQKSPEGQKIQFGDAYLKRLVEAFKTGLTKARETQVKATCWGCVEPTSVPPPPAKPRMFVEPVPAVYLRYGRMYEFLEKQVLPLFPAEDLDQAHPLDERGEVAGSVRERVAMAKQLMFGLYLVACDELGLVPEAGVPEPEKALAAAKLWLAGYQHDPLITYDTRVAVPVKLSSEEPRMVTYWGTAGVTMAKVQFTFDHKPDGSTESEPATYFVAADKFISFQRPLAKGLLDRTAYRQVLDGAPSLSEALKRLSGG